MILSIYGKIRLRFCLYTEKFGYDSVYIRKNTATTLSIYGKMRLRLCLYTEKYGYDSVYIRKNRGERKPSFRYILRKDFEEMKFFY